MGKFKRKRSKVYKTSASPTTCEKIVEYVDVDKRGKTKGVIKDFYISLKKRNKFGNFIHDFYPLKMFTEPTDAQMEMKVDNIFRGGKFITIGDKFTLFLERKRGSGFVDSREKIKLINTLLYVKANERKTLTKEDVLEYFLHDELEKLGENKSRIPTNAAFMMRFATIFGICGFLTFNILIFCLLSPLIAYYFSLSSTIIMLSFKCSIKYR